MAAGVKRTDAQLMDTVNAFQVTGSQKEAAELLGVGQPTISKQLKEARERGLFREHGGRVEVFESKQESLPAKGKKKVYYLTCAQNYTKLHADAWKNLMALVAEDDAKLLVSTFKYNKDAQGQRAQAKWETKEQELAAEYPKDLIPYICDDRIDIAPNLTFCGELNVLPTAVNPLEGLENYTYRRSTVVPHARLELRSIPTMKSEGVKLMYTTGCITQRNYIKRKAGFKAEHFHTYGALLVEVDEHGSWWCRHVIHGPDGAMHDLNRRAYKGKVEYAKVKRGEPSPFVADICWGDIHAAKLDQDVAGVSFGHGENSMLEFLRPHTQHVHDLLDFGGRSHHTRKDPHEVYRSFIEGRWELTAELKLTADVLWNRIARPWCETIVVNSNHDRHLQQWLKEVDWRFDPANAEMLLSLNLTILRNIRKGLPYNLTRMAMLLGHEHINTGEPCPIRFLDEDESHVILPHIDGGIEAGLHGDRGANGAKGTIVGLAKTDRKMNIADKHQVAINGPLYCCGLTGKLEMGYNHGLSSWTQAHTVTYINGTRAIYSIWKGKFRA